ncbi:MAG TPA: DEAD/DEAH box helicase, partial [Candidatus Nanoarchaeia archaeon]|nr:DEAD/DEAH box helicase [Candidatus Nanoarchaeia archaeon]
MLLNFTPRLYQETILATAARKNTLVVLPTGLGKTAIAFMLAAQRLRQYPQSKILFLSPTKPLAEQHFSTFQKHLDMPKEKFALFTGAVSPEKRQIQWKDAQVIIGTPQGIENDVLGDKIALENVSLLILDEAHHATGDYSYCFLAQQYMKKANFTRILGLTASPGSDAEKIKEVCKHLHIEAVEIRTLDDPDVAQYIQETTTEWLSVNLPTSFAEILVFLKECSLSRLRQVKQYGYLNTLDVRKKELLMVQAQLFSEAQGNKDPNVFHSLSLLAGALKVEHAIELLETQGIAPLYSYFQKLEVEAREGKTKAAQALAADINFKSAFIKASQLFEAGIKHPKLVKLTDIVEQEIATVKKILIFTQYRDSATAIVESLSKLPGITAKIFVGQTKKGDTGMSQKQQKELMEDFRAGNCNILVCTSVGEEGLDIPEVDLVIFYEPIPSAIRHIQRRGRTGRHDLGRVIILMAAGTRDVRYRWVAHHKEQRMVRILKQLKKTFVTVPQDQPTLASFVPKDQKITIIVDYREKGSDVMKELVNMGISLQLERLESADYLCSAQCAVEFKTVDDFVTSLVDGRMLEQLRNLKKFNKPLILVQGTEDMYAIRKVHAHAIQGMLAAITVSFGIPLLQTKNAKETASLLAVIAKR